MRRLLVVWASIVMTCTVVYGNGGYGGGGGGTDVNVNNQVNNNMNQQQNVNATGGNATAQGGNAAAIATGGQGGNASSDSTSYSNSDSISWSDSDSSASASINTTNISEYEARVQPLSTYAPYLPMWNHGGWGTVKGYFPNGPSSTDHVYERIFDPTNEDDVREVKKVLSAMPHTDAFKAVGGIFNGLSVLFGGPNNYHHGRGVEISNSLVRDRRPDGKPLIVFIDSNVDVARLEVAGYAYVGRIGLEGTINRNWDHVYNAAVAEALPWDVDVLLISGGMKGVTVGTTKSLPSGLTGAYSNADMSLSILGGQSTGITEGKGEAVLSATAYRFCPEMIDRRRIPSVLYNKFRVGPQTASANVAVPQAAPVARMSPPAERTAMRSEPQQASVSETRPQTMPGIPISSELYRMAGFSQDQTVGNVAIR